MHKAKIVAFNLCFSLLLAAVSTAYLFFPEESVDDGVSMLSGTVFRTAAYGLEEAEQLKRRLISSFGLSREKAHQFSRWITEASYDKRVPENLLSALILAESHFRYKVTSHVGAVGPAQLMEKFWGHLCEGDLENDPEANVHCGAVALSHYYNKRCAKDAICAVTMYNVGPTAYFSKTPKAQAAMDRYLAKINYGLNRLDGVQISQVNGYWD